jgi:CheY-like chemotaxis protein
MSHELPAGTPAGELARSVALARLCRRGRVSSRGARSLMALGPSPGAGSRGETAAAPRLLAASTAARPVRRILCADREAGAVESLVRALRLAGFDARGCADSAAALVEVTDFRPHACVLDLNTPGLGGYELARWARATVGDRVLLIAVTDRTGVGIDRRAAAAGFDLVFTRPADPVLVIGLAAGPRPAGAD